MPILADAGYHVVAPRQRPSLHSSLPPPRSWPTDGSPGRNLGGDTEEYGRTGFQALQASRVFLDLDLNAELRLFSGTTIDVQSLFIGGKSDWGTYAAPGALDLMRTKATTGMRSIELIDGAGHWIQQEQPARFSELLLAFVREVGGVVLTSG